MALRLLSYILRIWERFAQSNPTPAKLPAILPMVLAQGRRQWKTSTNLEDLIDLPPALAPTPAVTATLPIGAGAVRAGAAFTAGFFAGGGGSGCLGGAAAKNIL
jgi:hypothetical protein